MKGDKVIIIGSPAQELIAKIAGQDISFCMDVGEINGEPVVVFEARD
jgi:hypothetical protein